jgi:hypothetical protein
MHNMMQLVKIAQIIGCYTRGIYSLSQLKEMRLQAVSVAPRVVEMGESRTQQQDFSGSLVAASNASSGSWHVNFVQ